MPEIHQVTPNLPTVAGDRNIHPVLGTDLWTLVYVENLHVFPDILDISRFNEGLSKALSAYPSFAGRVRHRESDWWIDLTNSPVPVSVVQSESAQFDAPDTAVLDNIRPYVDQLAIPHYINTDRPLLKVKITTYPKSNQTAIGLMFCHVVTDGSQSLSFTRLISDYYQGLSPDAPPYVVPQPFPPPELEPAVADQVFEDNPILTKGHYPLPTLGKYFWEELKRSVRIDVRLSPSQVAKLKALASDGPKGNGLSISRQDAISAYIVTAINRCIKTPITCIQNNFNFRPFVERERVGGNAIWFIQTKELLVPDFNSLPHIATAIRESIERAKQPEVATLQLSVISQLMLAAANLGHGHSLLPVPGKAIVNSNLKYDWNSPHFGYPGRTRFHTAWCADRYIRVLRSNPIQNADGTWDSREGYVDVAFKVEKSIRDEVDEIIRKDLESLDTRDKLAQDV